MYVDFAKAFDTVCHNKLFHKLPSLGINGNLLKWIQDRTQITRIGTSLSGSRNLTSSVIQGSCIGPLLFVLYINDVVNMFNYAIESKLYADDLKLHSEIVAEALHSEIVTEALHSEIVTEALHSEIVAEALHSEIVAEALHSEIVAEALHSEIVAEADHLILQHGLDDWVSWSNKWQLTISFKKCLSMQVGRSNTIPDHKYSLGDCLLPNLTFVKDLGVTIDNKLIFF